MHTGSLDGGLGDTPGRGADATDGSADGDEDGDEVAEALATDTGCGVVELHAVASTNAVITDVANRIDRGTTQP